jgi:TP901 family phage tail tape measure protein
MADVDRKLIVRGEADFNKLRKELDATKQLLLDLGNTANRVRGALTRLEGGSGRGPGANPILKALGGQSGINDIEKKMEASVSRYTRALSDGLKAIRAESAEALVRAARVNAEVNRINANSITETTKIIGARLSVAKQSAALPLRQLVDQYVTEKNAGLAGFATSVRGQTSLSEQQLLQLKAREQAAELLRQRAIGQAALLNTAEARKELDLRTKQSSVLANILKELNSHLNVNKEIEKIQQRMERRQLAQQIDPTAQIAAQRKLLREMEQANIRFYKASTESLQSQINSRLIPDRSRDREYIGLRVQLEREAEKAAAAERQRVQRETARTQPGGLAAVSRQRTLDRIGGPEGGAFLFEIQSRLLLNYRLMYGIASSIRQGTQFVIEFEDELKRLQAISGITGTELEKLRTTILDVSEGTRFAAAEVTRSAVVLAQAGLSTQQIGQVLQPIIQLAQSTGSEVGKVVDVFTSILGVFNVQTAESVNIANQLASALNVSKLDIEKFALATQYAANAAAQSNVSFSEFASVLATLSNAGIRSGSTLGTGLSQLITQLISPSAELAKVLKQVGLTVSDVDVRSKGLIGVLETLKASGFGAAQAFQGLDLRAARTLVALNKNTEALLENQRQILLSEAAAYGSQKATESFAAAMDILRANAGAAASDITRNLLGGMTQLVKIVASVVAGFRDMSGVLSVILNLGIGIVFVGIAKYVTGVTIALARNVLVSGQLVTAWKAMRASMAATATTMDGVAVAATRMGSVMRVLRFAGPLLLFTAFELLVNGLLTLGNRMDGFSKKMEAARTEAEEASQRLQAQRETVNALNTAIQTVNERYDYLTGNEKALQIEVLQLNKQFAAQGLVLSLNTKKVDDLIEALTRLKRVSDQKYLLDLSVEGNALQKQQGINSDAFSELLRKDNLLGNLGISQAVRGGQVPLSRLAVPPEVMKVMDLVNQLNGQSLSELANDAGFTSQLAQSQTNISQRLQTLRQLQAGGERYADGAAIGTQIKRLEMALAYVQKLNSAINTELSVTSKLGINSFEQIVTAAGLDPQIGALEKREQEFARELKRKVDAAEKAPIGDRAAMLDDIQAFIDSAKKEGQESLSKLLENLTDEQKKAVTEAYNRKVGSVMGETLAREANRIEKALDESNKAKKKLIEEQIRSLEDELKNINSTFDDAQSGQGRANINREANAKLDEIIAKKRELLKVENDINKDKVDALERELNLNREIAARYEAQDQRALEAQQRADQLERELADARSSMLERSYRKQIDAIKRELTGESGKGISAEKRAELLAKIEELLIAILNLKLQAIIRQAQAAGQSVNDPRVQEQIDAARSEYEATVESIQDTFKDSGLRQAREEFSRGFKTAVGHLAREFRSLNDVLERAAKDLENANQRADDVSSEFDNRAQAYKSPQNKNRVPSVIAEAAAIEQQFEVDNTVRALKISAQRGYLDTLQKTRDELTKLLADARALLKEKAKIEGVDYNADDINDPANALVSASSTVNRAAEEVRKYEEKLRDLDQQIGSTTSNLGRMESQQRILNERLADPSMWDALRAGIIVWREQSGAAQNFVTSVGNAVPGMLDSMSQAWAQFSDNLINRTTSIKGAFKELARSILASMLKVINDAITKQFTNLLANLILGGGNPYSMPSSSGGNFGFDGGAGGSWINFIRGGMVPKRRAMGGVSTRDSVPLLTQPGEYLLRQSAVSMIGRGTLDTLNAMGNRRVSGTLNGMTPYQAPPPAEPSVTNVWVVQDKQAPPPGPKDIIAVIGADIRNGGATKQLIKSVQSGMV